MEKKVIIIGAGLSGLVTAYRLKQQNISFVIIEARNRIGGRILTEKTASGTTLEMGATWFGSYHTNLIALINELELSGFEQYMSGDALFQPFSFAEPQKMQLPQQNQSYRIVGGTSMLINKLASFLTADELILNEEICSINFIEDNVIVKGKNQEFKAEKVITTLPPKLLLEQIKFTPNLPENLTKIANKTHTWMHNSIKLGISFTKPFWREENLSGTLFSNVGPVTEFYDHNSVNNSTFGMCGFVNGSLAELDADTRKDKIMQQLVKVYGTSVEAHEAYNEVVWSEEEYTSPVATEFIMAHQNNGNPIFQQAYFEGRLYVSGTETSPEYGGYMDGAVYMGNLVAEKITTEN